MSANPLVNLFDIDLNSDRNRAIARYLVGSAGTALARIFPTRAAACYTSMIIGFGLAFVPIAKAAPVRFTLVLDDTISRRVNDRGLSCYPSN